MSNSYSVVFCGRLAEGFTQEQVRANFAGLFKAADASVIDRIFSGKRVLLHKGLEETEAHKRVDILRRAGAICEISQETPPAASPPPAPQPQAEHRAEAPSTTTPSTASATTAAAIPPRKDVPTPAPARLELGGGAPVSTLSHHQQALKEREAERTSADEPRFQVRQDAAVAAMDARFTPWDPHFFPDCARGLSWGGFFAPFLWGTFNGLRLSFLPALGVRFLRAWVPAWAWILFYLAFGTYYLIYGREMAWEHKSWRNADHFIRVQRYWTIGSTLIFILSMAGLIHLTVKEHEAARFAAATGQY
jgi:hypothetical protein